MREKEYSEWMGKQGFDALRHANCCKIAFNGGWESRQTEVDELQKQLIDQGQRFNDQSQLVKDLEHKNAELQKRVEAVLKLIPSLKAENNLWGCDQVDRQIELLEQALKGEQFEEHREKAEQVISNGASLTKHRIDL